MGTVRCLSEFTRQPSRILSWPSAPSAATPREARMPSLPCVEQARGVGARFHFVGSATAFYARLGEC